MLISCVGEAKEQQDQVQTSAEHQEHLDTLIQEKPLYCNASVQVGASRIDQYLPLLEGKKVGIVGNQSSMIVETHLVDTLLKLDVSIAKVFSPEHGFRGTADAGEHVDNEYDQTTGLPIISLYGKNRKPKAEQLKGLDVLVFDIQDVGVRFYTYISTLHYVMEAAAENDIPLIVLDRPNPNGHYVDGPVLKEGFDSFVGMHQVPVVHGMTVGEYAQMINGEGWLKNGLPCELTVIPCKGWDHASFYELPIAPSPNLPNMTSVYLYPQLCFFEGTVVSIGRGTDYPFQVIGHPDFEETEFSFIPTPNQGASHPKLEGETCFGVDLHDEEIRELRKNDQLDLSYLIEFYQTLEMGDDFFLSNNFINLLAGTDELKRQLLAGNSMDEIRASWQTDLTAFMELRKKYLLYPE
jgi:uncharacterized protein YbbC (DUF1343 family)